MVLKQQALEADPKEDLRKRLLAVNDAHFSYVVMLSKIIASKRQVWPRPFATLLASVNQNMRHLHRVVGVRHRVVGVQHRIVGVQHRIPYTYTYTYIVLHILSLLWFTPFPAHISPHIFWVSRLARSAAHVFPCLT